MAWNRPGHKPFSGPMTVNVCVARFQLLYLMLTRRNLSAFSVYSAILNGDFHWMKLVALLSAIIPVHVYIWVILFTLLYALGNESPIISLKQGPHHHIVTALPPCANWGI